MTMQWQNQVVLITGASGGIGNAMAKALDEKGAHLILAGRNDIKLKQLQRELVHDHTIVTADITTLEGRNKIVEVCERWPVSILINNAGTTHVGQFDNSPVESLISTNVISPMLLTQGLLPLLAMRPQPHVVNVGSAFGSIGFAAHSAYCASKFAIKGWTEAMLREYHDSNIRFHYLAPRATDTAINDERAIALNTALGNQVDSPEVVAKALITLLEKDKSRLSLGFAERFFAKLNALFPALVDNALAKKLSTIKRLTFDEPKSRQSEDKTPNAEALSTKLV